MGKGKCSYTLVANTDTNISQFLGYTLYRSKGSFGINYILMYKNLIKIQLHL